MGTITDMLKKLILEADVDVKNVNGTGDQRYSTPPAPHRSWMEFWASGKKSNKNRNWCSNIRCTNKATKGAHVIKANDSDKSWYITPLCDVCNQISSEETFIVRQKDLVALV